MTFVFLLTMRAILIPQMGRAELMNFLLVRIVYCVFFVVLLTGISANAGQPLAFGVDDRDWAGHYQWANGALVGIDADVLRTVANKLGYSIVFMPLPWPRVMLMAKEKSIDGVLDLAPTVQRKEFLSYVSTPISMESTVFWVKRGSSYHYSGAFDSSMRIGLMHGSDWSDRFAREGMPTVEVFYSYQAVFNSLIAGRIDAFGGYLAPTQDQVRRLGFVGKVEPSEPMLHGLSYSIAFTQKGEHIRLAKTFSDALKVFYKSAEYDRLLEQYGGVDIRPWLKSKEGRVR
ncbi:substrate-binding periplasmic protein [Pseudodesulfovibrio nedwellii]|nr:transporter substrate-binding domain-containing protein [Pseudodesulfovibrio nedwellii]